MILDLEPDDDDDCNHAIKQAAKMLYGLVHARYIVTNRGIAKMLEKQQQGDFGQCQRFHLIFSRTRIILIIKRVHCQYQEMVPIGISNVPEEQMVKLYCPKCQDIYNPKASRQHHTDGAYFGTNFPVSIRLSQS